MRVDVVYIGDPYPFTDFAAMQRLTFPKSQTHMNLLSISRIPLHIPPPLTSCSYKPQNLRILKYSVASLPARDRVIDFGKYKGKMLGTLPSTYLKWVSKNLRARDFEEWAQLADQVLDDPVYKDRIEWEFAQNVLEGDVLRSSSSRSTNQEEESPVAELAEISERFGWDCEDKLGWAKVDFELLGASIGGRLPRLSTSGPSPRPNDMGSGPNLQTSKADNTGGLSPSRPRPIGEKRKERLQRMKIKRESSSLDGRDIRVDCGNSSEVVLIALKEGGGNVEKEENTRTNITKSSFPGRESLLKKVL